MDRVTATLFLQCMYERRSFRQAGGTVLVSRLAKSKQHPMKMVFAANKVCCKHTIIAELVYYIHWSSLGPSYSPAFDNIAPLLACDACSL